MLNLKSLLNFVHHEYVDHVNGDPMKSVSPGATRKKCDRNKRNYQEVVLQWYHTSLMYLMHYVDIIDYYIHIIKHIGLSH